MTGRIVIVTGTSTEVGKTVATAALAATTPGHCVVLKPVQTGIALGEPTDCDIVHALTGRPVVEFTALEEPLAPETAARRAGVAIPTVAEHAARIATLTELYEVVIVEGSGGLLVRLDTAGGTLLDLAATLTTDHPDHPDHTAAVEVVVVCTAALGTLNHTELTLAALRSRGVAATGLVLGSWPAEPGLAERCNLEDLPRVTGLPLLAVVPAGSGALSPADFVAAAPTWFTPPPT